VSSLDYWIDKAIESLLEENMEGGNGHAASVSGTQLEDVFGSGAGRAIFRHKLDRKSVDPGSYNVSGQWRWAEREAFLRSLESNDEE
jgi:hypothetical protein